MSSINKANKKIVNASTQLKNQFHSTYFDNFGDLSGKLELDFIILFVLSLLFFASIFFALNKIDAI